MSITRDQFRLQIDRLVDAFGDRAFSEQREHMIWEIVKPFDYPPIISVVDDFIRGSRHAPLPADFVTSTRSLGRGSRAYALGEIQPIDMAKCWDCGDSGFIRLRRKPTFDKWAKWDIGSAPCHCTRGWQLIETGLRRKVPLDFGSQFSDYWRNSYEVMPAYSGHTTVTNDERDPA
jgi:hypothetical protein